MIWDEFLRHFRFCDEEDSGLSDEVHQAKKNFLEKFKTASNYSFLTINLPSVSVVNFQANLPIKLITRQAPGSVTCRAAYLS